MNLPLTNKGQTTIIYNKTATDTLPLSWLPNFKANIRVVAFHNYDESI